MTFHINNDKNNDIYKVKKMALAIDLSVPTKTFDKTATYDDGILRSPNIRFKTLNYPLKDDNNYKAKLSFQVVNEEKHRTHFSGDMAKAFTKVGPLVKGGIAGVIDQVQAFIGSGNGAEEIARLNGDLKNETKSGAGHTLTTAMDFGRINLYLPQALNMQDAAAYDNTVQLGRIGAMVAKKLPEGQAQSPGTPQGAYDTGKKMGQAAGGIGMAMAGMKMNPTVASIISQNLLSKVNEGASNALALQTQTTLNPNVRTLFRSVPIRQFAFQFTLIATSLEESKEINKIIEAFRTELYPEKLSVGGASYGYRYPRRFLLKASYRGKQWSGIKFLPAYLTSFNAIYNPNGMGFHKGGQWTEIGVSMNFSESRALGKQDIEVGY